jgi:hypothetical protein
MESEMQTGEEWRAQAAPGTRGSERPSILRWARTAAFTVLLGAGAMVAPSGAVAAADLTAPATTLTGVANGAVLPYGSVAHITLVGADAGSGMASVHHIVDSVVEPVVTSAVRNGPRAANLFGAPSLAVPGNHPGGTAASITSGDASCIAAGCHLGWALPATGTVVPHTGFTSACPVCHTVVDAATIVEPSDHATHDPSWPCTLCHGTSIVGPVMPTSDNPGDVAPTGTVSGHFLGSQPDRDGKCLECHVSYAIAGAPPVSTASTCTTSFDVSGSGTHSISYWSVDKAGNTEATHTVTFSITPAPGGKTSTALSIVANPSSVKLPAPFVLSGVLSGPTGAGWTVNVWVRKPNRATYSYSSARLTSALGGAGSAWWYRYTPTMKGTYTFYVSFAGDATYGAASTLVTPFKVVVK